MVSRQRRLEKKKAKRTQKKRHFARASSMGLAERMARAADGPILDSALYSYSDEGMTQLLFSRQLRNGEVAMALFLVDLYCLGLKNSVTRIVDLREYREFVKKLDGDLIREEIDPPSARRLAEDAVAYARRYGFEPHPDARKALPLFGDVDPSQATRTFEFGKDGKPFYISGPYDTPARLKQIFATLERTAGEGGCDHVLNIGPSMPHFLHEMEDDEVSWGDDEEMSEEESEEAPSLEVEGPRSLPPA